MKTVGKVFFGVLFVILLISFSHASDVRTPVIVKNYAKGVTFKWDKDNDDKFYYIVYVYEAKNKDENPPKEEEFDNLKKLGRLKENSPIDRNQFVITFIKEQIGHIYFLGVQKLLYRSKDGKPIGEPIKSTISWSCNNDCTKNNPQYVEVSK